ncbi:MAG: 2-C-methyl-D-erythritol 4-phosphate cytidylyltransferase [Congregibacter sp.]
MSAVWAVIPAAGSGSRMRDSQRKQFLLLLGRSVLSWSVAAVMADERVRGCVIALPANGQLPSDVAVPRGELATCLGGETRAASVLAGLYAVAESAGDDDWVLVHDAARPCLSADRLRRLIDEGLSTSMGALLALPVADTLKRSDADLQVLETVDREGLWRAQTPQMFRLGELRAALQQAIDKGRAVTDESAAMEAAGHSVRLVEGDSANVKVTFPEDLPLAQHWLEQHADTLSQKGPHAEAPDFKGTNP